LKKIVVGLGWDSRSTDGATFDLNGSAFLLKADGKVRSDADFIFYNNLKSSDGSIPHAGDNQTGEGDDERIIIDLQKVPTGIERISIGVTIHEAEARHQNFSMGKSHTKTMRSWLRHCRRRFVVLFTYSQHCRSGFQNHR
jgi:tellurium resistance protein TerD